MLTGLLFLTVSTAPVTLRHVYSELLPPSPRVTVLIALSSSVQLSVPTAPSPRGVLRYKVYKEDGFSEVFVDQLNIDCVAVTPDKEARNSCIFGLAVLLFCRFPFFYFAVYLLLFCCLPFAIFPFCRFPFCHIAVVPCPGPW